ncbi:MAG: glycolate oxidase subunit GlcE [Pseudomonadota bacterium]|nr:glycolate oxidase subunit GlcE [Pseudomonadota bacterium]
MDTGDNTEKLESRVRSALRIGYPLCIRGGNTKAFYGRIPVGEPVDVRGHTGIVDYEPTELVITARSGTTLNEIEAALAAENQILPFDPPHFGEGATIGGTIACNLSGPRRAQAGAARDFILGCGLINGTGEVLRFGGQVMKNVAGYDVSRLMCGALGTLGVLLEMSLKVLPKPETEETMRLEATPVQALDRMKAWGRRALPVSATCQVNNSLYARLSGTGDAVAAARKQIGGESADQADAFWEALREHRLVELSNALPLWRLSVAPDSPPADLEGNWVYEWNGALRWLSADVPISQLREAAAAAGGHATLFRNSPDRDQVFHPLNGGLTKVHRRLKRAFDPAGIFNPGRMYPDL